MCKTQQIFIMFIIVLGQHISVLTEPYSGPSKVQICILEGPEDDSIRIETCCPNTIINIIKFSQLLIPTHAHIHWLKLIKNI